MTHGDGDTRERLIEAASRLFGERGLRQVTVRDICGAAEANVAAVNYHFGDKLGLYREVLERAIAVMQDTVEQTRRATAALPVEDRLRAHIVAYVRRLATGGGDSWVHRLISREMAEPTAALDEIVNRAIRPRIRYVASIQAQCTMSLPHPIRDRVAPRPAWTAAEVDALAAHVVAFSLAGIRALAAQNAPRRRAHQ